MTALTTDPIAPDAAQTAPAMPTSNATIEPPAARVGAERPDQLDDRLRRDRVEEALQRVVGADQVEQPDERDDRGEEREQRAVRDLLREAEAVVGEEPLDACA